VKETHTHEELLAALDAASDSADVQTIDAPSTASTASDGPASQRALRDGTVVDGKYEILALLDCGGMGEVQLVNNEPALERFRRTVAEQINSPRHDHVVATLDSGEHGNMPYLVMELVEGANLRTYIQAQPNRRLPWREAVHFAEQIAQGLAHAHAGGIIHRDIKPANVMRAIDGRVRILDWGLARQTSIGPADRQPSLTPTLGTLGTPDFMAPEQALRPKEADARSDLYSLGCTLYYFLTGHSPFAHQTSDLAKQLAQLHGPSPQLHRERPDLPTSLCRLVARLLARQPEKRFQTAVEAAAALRAIAETPDDQVETVTDSRRRSHRRWAILAGGLAALLSVVVYIETARGTIEIESFDDAVELSIVDTTTGKEIDVVDTQQHDAIRLRVRPGEYEVKVLRGTPEFRLEPNRFSLVRGGTVVVTVQRVADNHRRQELADRTRAAAEWVVESGGNVGVSFRGRTTTVSAVVDLPAEPFAVEDVFLPMHADVTDSSLQDLGAFSQLKSLRLHSNDPDYRLTNSAFRFLEKLPHLEQFVVDNLMNVTDIPHLATLTQLTHVGFDGTAISGKTLNVITQLPKLERLHVTGTRILDADLAALSNAGQLVPQLSNRSAWGNVYL